MSETLSFSARIKEELAAIPVEKSCCAAAELAGLLLAAGSIRITQGSLSLEVSTENEAIAQRAGDLLTRCYGDVVRVERHERRRLNRNYSYRVIVPQEEPARQALKDSGMLRGEGIKASLVRKSCCRNAMLRGLFLGCGTMVDPEKSYQVELIFTKEDRAAAVNHLLTGSAITAKIVKRNQYFVVYIKEGESISTFLALIGAHGALLQFEDVRTWKELRNSINRRANCDNANLDKSINASFAQREAIERLIAADAFDSLSDDLKEAAHARLDDPEATLQELAEALRLSKSGVNHRLKKLSALAAELDQPSMEENNG